MNLDIVGLDLSLTSTGLYGSSHQIAIQSQLRGVERLLEISNQLTAIFKEIPRPAVVLEGYSFASKSSQAHAIGELGGVVRLALHQSQIPWVEVPPTNRAKFATGRGNASKIEVVSAISARTGITWTGKGADDLCDAFVLYQMGMAVIGRSEYDWPAANLAALDKVNWHPIVTRKKENDVSFTTNFAS